MNAVGWMSLLCGLAGVAALGTLAAGRRARRPDVAARVLAHVPRQRPADAPDSAGGLAGLAAVVFGPVAGRLAAMIAVVAGSDAAVRRRLDRAGMTGVPVAGHRLAQAWWGLAAAGAALLWAGLRAVRDPGTAPASAVVVVAAFAAGAVARDQVVGSRIKARERDVMAQLPAVAELLALAVAAGESPIAALERVTARFDGVLAEELGAVLADIGVGTPVASAFDAFARRTQVVPAARFGSAVAVAVERGTPLAEVLHAQAGDVREAGRRALIEAGARRELLMQVPVVLLVLPSVVLMALFPAVAGLSLSV